jgi:hypothetical protein
MQKMKTRLVVSLCVFLNLGIMLIGCAPMTPSSITKTPINPAAVKIETSSIPEPTKELVATEIAPVPEPTKELAPTDIPNNVVLWFKALKGIANVNGFEQQDGEMKVGDILSTDAKSFVEISMPSDDRALFEVKPNSVVRVEIATIDAIRLYLEAGIIRTSVKENSGLSVTIAAKAGESQAGGTVWISEVDETGALLVAVLEGRVVARAPGGYEVEVKDGERSTIPVNGVPGWPESTIFVYFHSSMLGNTYLGTEATDEGWDTSQPPTLTGRYSRMTSELISAGFIIEDSANPEPLGTYDVLISIDSAYALSDENKHAIQNWVATSKGLLYVVDSTTGFFHDPSNMLLEPYGIKLNGTEGHGMDQLAKTEPGHWVTDGITNLPLYNYCQLDGGIPLATTSYGEVVLAAHGNGGRVLVLCDTDSIANIAWTNHPDCDQSKFIVNAIKWLADQK